MTQSTAIAANIITIITARNNRTLAIAAYKGGSASWGAVFKDLFNAGWRGPMDRDGFPTRLARAT